MIKPRVRFAPSPTGPLHIGGVRTALYNYLFAKQHGGDFLLRIEDTDQTRFVEGAEEYIIESFRWLGIPFDEGVSEGGNYGPYRQSERKNIYRQYADQLIATGNAYYAFDSETALTEKRKAFEQEKKNFQYGIQTRMEMSNSLTLTKEEVDNKIKQGEPFVIRYKFPEDIAIIVPDLIRGEVIISSNLLDDKVLYKSDGMPTYHLANIVDDHLMKITHVIRGEEWLPSAPLHVMLYKALGWEAPQFAHLPLILKPDGNGKLSKRDGDRLGFPVFPLQWKNQDTGEFSSGYRESGYLPEAVINMLALLGWNPGTEQELFSLEELTKHFSLDKISKSGAKFDPEKAKWFNQQYIRIQTNEELALIFKPQLREKGIDISMEKLSKALSLVKERLTLMSDFWEQSHYLFIMPEIYDPQVITKRWQVETPLHLTKIMEVIQNISPFDKTKAHDEVMSYIKMQNLNTGQIMNCLRLSLVGSSKGPDLFELIDFLGVDEIVKRVNNAIETIKHTT